jgi:hypothetical protein
MGVLCDSRLTLHPSVHSFLARRKYALDSVYFNAQNENYVELFDSPDEEEAAEDLRLLRMGMQIEADGEDSDKACRFCLVDSGELVAPCECKGSGAWVHVGCLRQWQKSVLLTQSTHPQYQTHIDEVSVHLVALQRM